MTTPRRPTRPEAGLCADCRHAHVVETARRSVFWRCTRAETDPRYLRYPPLPVRVCPGHEPRRGA